MIVITLELDKLEKFAQSELGVLLGEKQLKDIPQAAVMLMDALKSDMGPDVIFESFARVFLTKLVRRYGLQREDDVAFSKSFTSKYCKHVLDYAAVHFGDNVNLETMAAEAGLSPSSFPACSNKQSAHRRIGLSCITAWSEPKRC